MRLKLLLTRFRLKFRAWTLRRQLAKKERRALFLETEIEKLRAAERVHGLQMKQLLNVVERDKNRVLSESAKATAETQHFTTPLQPIRVSDLR